MGGPGVRGISPSHGNTGIGLLKSQEKKGGHERKGEGLNTERQGDGSWRGQISRGRGKEDVQVIMKEKKN